MNGSVWAVLIGAVITGLGSVATTVITWRRFSPQDKATTAKSAAEARSIDLKTFNETVDRVGELSRKSEEQDDKIFNLQQTIRQQDEKIKQQDEKLAAQGAQIAELQERNRNLGRTMRAAVVELLAWIKRALSVMTPAQQTEVGKPPEYEHLIAPPEKS